MSRGSVYGSALTSPVFSTDLNKEFQDTQSRTFKKWLNAKLELNGIPPMNDLAKDLSDGVKLIQLMEIMGGCSLGRYNHIPRIRVQKAENVNKALEFIRSRGVILTNIGPEDIIDGNLKLILGMIWTLILRFTIADISEEGLTAKDGLLLWCQRKTAPYAEVSVQDFSTSWTDGLALCALIHRHRPDLLDYYSLDKSDRYANTRLAFQVAQDHLGIPQLLEVEDLCSSAKPDDRSVMTYVAQFFHAFSSMDRVDVLARRVTAFAENINSIWTSRNEYERRVLALLSAIQATREEWVSTPLAQTYASAKQQQTDFKAYKLVKRDWVSQKSEISALFGNIITKLKTYNMKTYIPPPGISLPDVDEKWKDLLVAEADRSRAINANIRRIKEELRKRFAALANDCERRLQEISLQLSGLDGQLEMQMEAAKALTTRLPAISKLLEEVHLVEHECEAASVEDSDYTIYSASDLDFEYGLVKEGLTKKLAFIENQMVARSMTNLTPAQLEEFESTFRYFDKDQSNTLNVLEFGAALASLGIVYPDDEIEQIHRELASGEDGTITFEAFISFLVNITEDKSESPEQIRESFYCVAGGKPYVTELDLRLAMVPEPCIEFLKTVMPSTDSPSNGLASDGGQVEECCYDYESLLHDTFS